MIYEVGKQYEESDELHKFIEPGSPYMLPVNILYEDNGVVCRFESWNKSYCSIPRNISDNLVGVCVRESDNGNRSYTFQKMSQGKRIVAISH